MRLLLPIRWRVLVGLGLVFVFDAACGPAAVAPPRAAAPASPVPRLAAPAPLDPDVRGAAYLNAVALQLQPGWGQFLDDCRVRLPATHPLNVMARSTQVELVIDRAGRVELATPPASGDADFDRAVRGVIADASPLPLPPAELRSDDDRAHLRWLFARDRRQAGPASASIVDVELPLGDAIAPLVARGELARAARRIARTPASDPARMSATSALMTAVLREAIGGADGVARRAAVVAIGRAHVTALAAEVRAELAPTHNAELRRLAAIAIAEVGDADAAPALAAALASDVRDAPRLVPTEARALVALGHADTASVQLAPALDASPPDPVAIAALAIVPDPARDKQLDGWLVDRDARIRAAACTALAGAPRGHVDATAPSAGAARPRSAALVRGLRDPDADVRAACATAATSPTGGTLDTPAPAVVHALALLLRDRDDAVRAAAVIALASYDHATSPAVAADPAPGVRAALATALGTSSARGADAWLRALAADRDADVRAAAFAAFVVRGGVPAELATGVPGDPSWRVRRAAAPGIANAAILAQLVDDPDPLVASDALVRSAAQLGAAAALVPALDRIAAAPPASAERVRAALAWLLAR